MIFNMASAAILDLAVKMNPNCVRNCFVRFSMQEIVQNDTLLVDIGITVLEKYDFMYFKMASAAILKNGRLQNFPTIFEKCMGAIFS